MRLKLTLQRRDGRSTDIVVTSDTTATVADIARRIVEADPAREILAAPEDTLTLSVAPPTSAEFTMLEPGLPISDAAVGSGFVAAVVNLGGDYQPARRAGEPAAALLLVVGGPLAGREISLPRGTFTIGRAPGNDVRAR